MLGILPTELVLYVLSFLPLRQLQRLPQVSKIWGNFIQVNQLEIYHASAILHGFVKPNLSLESAQKRHVWLQNDRSWKDLCRTYSHLERRWEGYEQPNSTFVGAAGKAVWRFKVDEEQSTVITTHFDGGIRVAAINGDVLWILPHTEVHAYAHCEYTDGYLVFTRRGDAVDIWRRIRDITDTEVPSTLQIDWRQQRARRSAWKSQLSAEQNDRGAFVPWTTILPPHSVHALRAANSMLLLASVASQEAYLYDIPNGKHIQTIPFNGGPEATPMEVVYVELSRRHIFVCGFRDVVVVPLDPNDSKTSLRFPSQIAGFHDLCEKKAYRIFYDEDDDPVYLPSADLRGTLIECMCEPDSEYSTPLAAPDIRNFKAVHVSPCGSHFVSVDESGCICIVRNFEQALRNETSLLDCITIINMHHPIMNLAFEDNKRIVVYVDRQGVFIIPLTSQDDISINTLTMEPSGRLRVLHVKHIDNESLDESEVVQFCSCLQMTSSEVWYSWTQMHARPEMGIANNFLRRIDFSASR